MAEQYLSLREGEKFLRARYPDKEIPSYETIRQAILNGRLGYGVLTANTRRQYIIPASVLLEWFKERMNGAITMVKEKVDGKKVSRKGRLAPAKP